MLWIIISFTIIATALFLLSRRREKVKIAQETLPYQKAESLFSPAERSFLGVLQQAVGTNGTIFGKVRVADVVKPKSGLDRSSWQKAFNKISGKHFDFLLCNKKNISVLCAIELNDASHNSKRRHHRDEFMTEVCIAAEVPLIQIATKSGYILDEVRQLIAPYLGDNATLCKESLQSQLLENSSGNGMICPKCSAAMVKRVAKKGAHVGEQFWACSDYPKCKTIEAVEGSL